MTIADDYINRVLEMMPRALPSRSQIATELRGHIAERTAHGQPMDDVLRQLGDPAALANSYLSAEPLVGAGFLRRAAAKVLDALSVLGVVCPLGWLATRIGPPGFAPIIMIFSVAIGGSLVFGIYTMIAERRLGHTLGKHLLGLRVVQETGARISVGQAIVRQLPVFLQFYWVDVLFALFTEKSQRAFEMLSQTRVVRVSPEGAR